MVSGDEWWYMHVFPKDLKTRKRWEGFVKLRRADLRISTGDLADHGGGTHTGRSAIKEQICACI